MDTDDQRHEPQVKPQDILWPAALAFPLAFAAGAPADAFRDMSDRLQADEPLFHIRSIPTIGRNLAAES